MEFLFVCSFTFKSFRLAFFSKSEKKVDFNAGKKEKKNRRDDEEEQEGGQQEFLYAYTLLQSKKLQ
jgi:hypothetical protein